jgi:hypothetical protein
MVNRTALFLLVLASMAVGAAAQVTGSGTTGTVPVFTGTSAVGNSPISVSSGNVGMSTMSATAQSTTGSNTFPSTGYVGIGTTTPWLPLQIITTGISGAEISTNNPSINIMSQFSLNLALSNTSATPGNYSGIYFADANGNVQGSMGMMYGAHTAMNQGTFYIEPRVVGTPSAFVVAPSGNVGIGTTSPGAKLEVNGGLRFTADPSGTVQTTAWTGTLCGGDYAESVDVTGNRTNYVPGDVLVLDADNPGKMLKSVEAYSTAVSGIYSTKPGTVGRRQTTPKSSDEVPMAVVGIVPAKVSAENGPIKVGDLLVTSSTSGYAMKGTDRGRMLGAIVGKAMAKLDSGTGVIEVLVTLQ